MVALVYLRPVDGHTQGRPVFGCMISYIGPVQLDTGAEALSIVYACRCLGASGADFWVTYSTLLYDDIHFKSGRDL